jgi:hypothetical protein
MAMNKTSAFQQAILNWVKGTSMATAPTSVYLCLFTSDPGEAGVVTGELASGTGYARQVFTLGSLTLSTDKHTTTNTGIITFGPFSSSVSPTHCGIATGSTRAVQDLIYYGVFTDSSSGAITATSGQTITVAAGALTLAEG